MPMKYMTVQEAAQKWNISDRRVRFLCSQGRIRGIIQQGRRYLIPDTTEKPRDERIRRSKHSDPRKYNDFTRLDLLKGLILEEPICSRQMSNRLDDSFLSQFTCHSSALSGSTLNQEEVNTILDGWVVADHSLAEHMGVVGCRDAMEYAMETVTEKKPLSQNIIRNIHSLIKLDEPMSKGRYRRVKVRVRQPESRPVYLDLMEPRINDLLNVNTQRKKVMHPIERITRFYLEFQGIHPFEDGNGRTGRVLMNLELMQNGYPPIVLSKSDEDLHQKAMQAFLCDHDPSRMIRLVSEKLESSMEKYLTDSRVRKHPAASAKKRISPEHAEPAAVVDVCLPLEHTASHPKQ